MAAPPSLYRKYRPRTFADLVGQEHVTRSVRNAITAGLVSHAYLFCGPRGSGKTSLAKIIAKTVNCESPADGEPCNACQSCIEANGGRSLDIIEIDAASNRKIDDIRHLREQVAYGPVSGQRKVYIIDEAHMLTKEASNAFLKTLEEPPEHVIFILCTTEPESIIPTILSRCQRYDFRKLSIDACLKRLDMVIGQEQPLSVTDEARGFLAVRGDGSMRDVLGLLDQSISYCGRTLDRPDIERTLGLVRSDVVDGMVLAIVNSDSKAAIRAVEEVSRAGTDMSTLLAQLIERFRTLLLVKSGNGDLLQRVVGAEALKKLQEMAESLSEPKILSVLQTLSRVIADLRQGLMPVFAVEVGLLSAIHGPQTAPAARLPVATAQPTTGGDSRNERSAAPRPVSPPSGAVSRTEPTPAPVDGGSGWEGMLSRLRREYPLTYAFVVEAQFQGKQGNEVRLAFDEKHAFHKGKLMEVKHEAILKKFVHEEFGPAATPKLVDGEAAPPATESRPPKRKKKARNNPTNEGSAPAAEDPPPVEGRDWYERKALKNRKVQELREAFDAEVLSIE